MHLVAKCKLVPLTQATGCIEDISSLYSSDFERQG
jgi:hypothetical protein